jgi:hypothetical protein
MIKAIKDLFNKRASVIDRLLKDGHITTKEAVLLSPKEISLHIEASSGAVVSGGDVSQHEERIT